MNAFTHIAIWVLASVVASLIAGFYIGRHTSHAEKEKLGQQDRRAALTALVDLLSSVQALTTDVDSRNTEMREVHRHVGDIKASGELEQVRQVLLGQVIAVLESNQKLEEDLGFARCRMEEQAEELDRTRREAHTDSLSGVANRKAFDDKLQLLLGYHKREGEPFVLILADMDHFKWINDTYGHQAGDRVLQQLGSLLKSVVRQGDFVGRYGGDEFAALLPKTSLDTGLKVAQRLHLAATRTNFGVATSSEQTAITVSLGVSSARPGDTPESIIERADEGLYASKKGGRNQVRCLEEITEDPQPVPEGQTAPSDSSDETLVPAQ
ncbi:MAG: GGDEF domain-containing protein [Pirellulales bacterium]